VVQCGSHPAKDPSYASLLLQVVVRLLLLLQVQGQLAQQAPWQGTASVLGCPEQRQPYASHACGQGNQQSLRQKRQQQETDSLSSWQHTAAVAVCQVWRCPALLLKQQPQQQLLVSRAPPLQAVYQQLEAAAGAWHRALMSQQFSQQLYLLRAHQWCYQPPHHLPAQL
jgi:hypothetical protein